MFTEPFPRNGNCLQSHRLATGLYATIQSLYSYLAGITVALYLEGFGSNSSAATLTVVTQVFGGFPQFVEANAGLVPRLHQNPFIFFPNHHSTIFLRFDSTQCRHRQQISGTCEYFISSEGRVL
jgi:hypothetical protein